MIRSHLLILQTSVSRPVTLENYGPPRLYVGHQFVSGPRFVHVTRRKVGVLERGAVLQVIERLGEVVVDVRLGVVCPEPAAVLGLDAIRVLRDRLLIDPVLMVHKAQLLTAGDALEAIYGRDTLGQFN